MIALSVNLNKIALIRNSREGNHPDVLSYAERCITAGADGITVHPRPDQRHIRAQDIQPLAKLCARRQNIEFNIEGNPFAASEPAPRPGVSAYPGFMALVEAVRPDQCTLVPDNPEQLTSDHGFDLSGSNRELQKVLQQLRSLGVRSSLFMDPDVEQIRRAARLGADRIELYTGPYAANPDDKALLKKYWEAAQVAADIGLGVNAGHDLNLDNLRRFRELPSLQEVSIGHALTVDSLVLGLRNAISSYRTVLRG